MQRFITISTYAKLCGINRESVYKRLKKGTLTVSQYCEHPLIDIEEFPPNKQRHSVEPPKVDKWPPF